MDIFCYPHLSNSPGFCAETLKSYEIGSYVTKIGISPW